MSFALTHLAGFGGKRSQLLAFEVGGAAQSTVDGASYTFAGVNIGTAATGRRVLVAFSGMDNGTTTSLVSATIGGTATTLIAEGGGTGTPAVAGFFVAQVDAGATADIVLTGAANAWQAMSIQVYALYGLTSDFQHDALATSDTTALDLSGVIDCPAGGVIFGVAAWRDVGVATTTTWTNLSTEVSDAYHDGQHSYSHAYEQFATSQTSRPIIASANQAPAQSALAVVSYGP